MRQGDIYLVQFGKKYNSEIGKVRPAVIMQNNFLNEMLQNKKYKNILVVPLTSDDILTEYKIFIHKRDKLKKDSFIIANWICTIDFEHIFLEKGIIGKLTSDEIKQLKEKICNLI